MPRPVALLCLVIALTGPLLTHAEAADDLARSLVELLDRGNIEPPDGGVGDDPIVASVWRAGPALDQANLALPAWDGLASPPALPLFTQDPSTSRRHWGGVFWLRSSTPRRYAWLQLFQC